MLKKKNFIPLTSLILFLFGSCASTNQLDLVTLEDNVFHISKVTVMVRQDMDEAGDSQIAKTLVPQILPILKESLKENNNVQIDDKDLNDLIEKDMVDIKLEQIEFSIIINKYSWENEKTYEQTASILISFAKDENGNIPTTVILTKANEENAQKPYTLSIDTPVNVD